jgi:hypothetical protein
VTRATVTATGASEVPFARSIDPTEDPDFDRPYPRRNDSESINRNLFLGRAHSLGRKRQLVELFGYALLVTGLPPATPTTRDSGGLAAARLPSPPMRMRW